MMSMSFSTKIHRYRSLLKLEILIDEDPLGKKWGYDDHFMINELAARAILAAMPEVWRFAESDGAEPDHDVEREVVVNTGLPVELPAIRIRRLDSFRPSGQTVQKPVLRLRFDGGSISFGLVKAKALVELEDDLVAFVLEAHETAVPVAESGPRPESKLPWILSFVSKLKPRWPLISRR